MMNIFAEFLKNQKNLETLELYWRKINIAFLEELCPMILKIQNLQKLKVVFGTNSEKYVKVHDSMLKEIRKAIIEAKVTEEVHFQIVCEEGNRLKTSSLKSAYEKSTAKLATFTWERHWTCLPFSFFGDPLTKV